MKYIISSLLCLFSLAGHTQTITVVSKEDKEPLAGASILCKTIGDETGKGMVLTADKEGNTKLNCTNSGQRFIITISFIGYETINDTIGCENKKYLLRSLSVELKNVVITAQYEPGSAENAVHKIRIIDSKEIEQRAANNLKDLLSQELNIRLTQDNVLGTGMTMQGVSGENVKILIDGVPVIGRTGGNIDLSQINLSNVERVEIVEGPLSVNYGTNALGGVINIITKKTQYERIEGGLDTYYETVGQYNTDINFGYKIKTHTFQLTGSRNFFDGWHQNDALVKFPKVHIADSTRFQDWKPREQYQGALAYHKNFKTLQMHVSSNYFKEEIINKGMPREPYYETAFDDRYHTNRFDNSISLSGKIGKSHNINLLAAYNDYIRIKNMYYNDLTTLEESITGNTGDQDTTKFKLLTTRGSYSTSKDSVKINYEFGYDLSLDNGFGQRIQGKEQHIGDYALFASAEYTPVKIITQEKFRLLVIRPGVRYSYNTVYTAPLVPSVNVMFRPRERMAIRASYARGFRAPAIKELYFEFVDINHNIYGNPDLKAETSDNFQSSFSMSRSAGRRFWRMEPSLFYNNINNLITLAYSGNNNLYSYINVGNYKTYGGQFNTEFGEQELMFAIGGSLYWTHSAMEQKMEHDGEVHTYTAIAHDYTPEIRSSVKYQVIKTKTQISLFYKYSGKMLGYHYDEDGELLQHWMNAYHTMDFTINQPLFKKRVMLAVGGKNLFNIKYIGVGNGGGMSHGGAHGSTAVSMPVNWGRTFFINLKINLSKRIDKK